MPCQFVGEIIPGTVSIPCQCADNESRVSKYAMSDCGQPDEFRNREHAMSVCRCKMNPRTVSIRCQRLDSHKSKDSKHAKSVCGQQDKSRTVSKPCQLVEMSQGTISMSCQRVEKMSQGTMSMSCQRVEKMSPGTVSMSCKSVDEMSPRDSEHAMSECG